MKREFYQAPNFSSEDAIEVSEELNRIFQKRRTVREFSSSPIPLEIIQNALKVANSSPSGANKQPWSFVIISDDNLKKKIKDLAEAEEKKFYTEQKSQKWVNDLKIIGTNSQKDFLVDCSYLIAVFYKTKDAFNKEQSEKVYYAKESTGIATGFLISALHLSGLSVLTYTPSKMQFLREFLERPQEEKPFMLLGVGKSKERTRIPVLSKKSLDKVAEFFPKKSFEKNANKLESFWP